MRADIRDMIERYPFGAAVSREGRFVLVNANLVRMLGYGGADELVGREFTVGLADEVRERMKERNKAREGGGLAPAAYETIGQRKGGEVFPVRVTVLSVQLEDGPATLSLIEEMPWEGASRSGGLSVQSLLNILDSLDAIVYVSDMRTYDLLFVNEYTRRGMGDIEGMKCWQSLQHGQSGPCEFCTNERLVDSEGNPTGPYRWEFRNTVNGRWYRITDRAIRWSDGRLVRLEIATDITDRKETEEKLRQAVKDKETLVRETHHRVKNNFMVLQSLLRLQRREEGASADALIEIESRLMSMNLIHEKLYRAADMKNVSLREFVKDFSAHVADGYSANKRGIQLLVDVPEVQLDVQKMIPLGLIINELLTNAFKYAFEPGGRGAITIALSETGEGEYDLRVSDNGRGLPEGFDPETTGTLGLQIVRSLAHQLHAELAIESDGGTSVALRFGA